MKMMMMMMMINKKTWQQLSSKLHRSIYDRWQGILLGELTGQWVSLLEG